MKPSLTRLRRAMGGQGANPSQSRLKRLIKFGRSFGNDIFFIWLGINFGFAAGVGMSPQYGVCVFIGAWLVMIIGVAGLTVLEIIDKRNSRKP